MITKYGWGLVAGLVGAMLLQGCAQTGGTQPMATSATPAAAAPVVPPADESILPRYHKGTDVVKADTKDNFEAVAAAIDKQMAPGGRWQYMNDKERAQVNASFADMRKLYDRFGSVDKMDQAAQVRLLADQSTVNAILTRKDGERLICKDEVPVGSHLPIRTCKTYAQVEAERQNAQRTIMDQMQRSGLQRTTN